MNPVTEVTSAAKSALTVKNLLFTFFSVLGVLVILDLLGWTQKMLFPASHLKSWWTAQQAKK